MKSIRSCDGLVSFPKLLVTIAVILTFIGSNHFLVPVAADHKEFEVETFDENITISPNALQAIDLDLQEGEEFEIVISLQVKENLPVDVWFVNEDHYTLLANGAQFLYFIDDSEQEVTYTRKIVTLTEHDLYKLVITNYHNDQTVEVNMIYEIRTYYADTDNATSNDASPLVFPLSILVIVLTILLLVLLVKARGYKQILERASSVASSKKQKGQKSKKHKPKPKNKPSSKEAKAPEFKETESERTDKGSPNFCGYCGTRMTTPYCTNCGKNM